jgi:hypothetical protein
MFSQTKGSFRTTHDLTKIKLINPSNAVFRPRVHKNSENSLTVSDGRSHAILTSLPSEATK